MQELNHILLSNGSTVDRLSEGKISFDFCIQNICRRVWFVQIVVISGQLQDVGATCLLVRSLKFNGFDPVK
jgi:hypothetical protein